MVKVESTVRIELPSNEVEEAIRAYVSKWYKVDVTKVEFKVSMVSNDPFDRGPYVPSFTGAVASAVAERGEERFPAIFI
jgi:hypothetical protein